MTSEQSESSAATDPPLPAPPDPTNLKRPLELGVTGLRQLLQCYHVGTDEVRHTLLRECDVLVECKVCRSLYRGLPNFLAHKRQYCVEKYAGTLVRFQDMSHKEDEVELCGSVFKDVYERAEEVGRSLDKVHSSPVVRLDRLEETSNAVSQVVVSQKRKAEDDLDVSMERKKLILPSVNREHLNGVRSIPCSVSVTTSRAFLIHNRLIKPSTNACIKCKASFASVGSMNKHMKQQHFKKGFFWACHTCSRVFNTKAQLIRHLSVDHGLSADIAPSMVTSPTEKLIFDNKDVYDIPESFSFMNKKTEAAEFSSSSRKSLISSSIRRPEEAIVVLDRQSVAPAKKKIVEMGSVGVLCSLGIGILYEGLHQNYKCFVHPSVKFRKFNSFKDHMLSQHINNPFSCPKCDMEFGTQDTDDTSYFAEFVSHLKNEHDITEASISVIRKELQENLVSDQSLLTDCEKLGQFCCEFCGNIYQYRSTLKRHLLYQHQKTGPNSPSIFNHDNTLSTNTSMEGNTSDGSVIVLNPDDPDEETSTATPESRIVETGTIAILCSLGLGIHYAGLHQVYKCLAHPSTLFKKFESLKDHILTAHCKDTFECPECSAEFSSNDSEFDEDHFSEFVKHLKKEHDITRVNIGTIRKSLQENMLKSDDLHLVSNCEDLGQFKCGVCGNVYQYQSTLKRHLLYQHNTTDRKFELSITDDALIDESRDPEPEIAKTYQLDATEAKESMIIECLGISSSAQSNIWQKFKCYKHPSVPFRRFTTFKVHVLERHCVAEIQCPTCQRDFDEEEDATTNFSNLVVHLTEDHGINEDNLDTIRTALQETLLQNIEDVKTFADVSRQCHMCGVYFSSRSSLRHHMNRIHLTKERHDSHREQEEVSANKSEDLDQEDDDEENEKSGLEEAVFQCLGIWGSNPKQYQKYKCFLHPNLIFKFYMSLKNHVMMHHCNPHVKCPECDEDDDAIKIYDFASHLHEAHNFTEADVYANKETLQNAMLLNPKDFDDLKSSGVLQKYEGDLAKPYTHREEPEKKLIVSMPFLTPARVVAERLDPADFADALSPALLGKSPRKQLSPSKYTEPPVATSTPTTESKILANMADKPSIGSAFALHRCCNCDKVFGKHSNLVAHEKICNVAAGSESSSERMSHDGEASDNMESEESESDGPEPEIAAPVKTCNRCLRTYAKSSSHKRVCRPPSGLPADTCAWCQRVFSCRNAVFAHYQHCKLRKMNSAPATSKSPPEKPDEDSATAGSSDVLKRSSRRTIFGTSTSFSKAPQRQTAPENLLRRSESVEGKRRLSVPSKFRFTQS